MNRRDKIVWSLGDQERWKIKHSSTIDCSLSKNTFASQFGGLYTAMTIHFTFCSVISLIIILRSFVSISVSLLFGASERIYVNTPSPCWFLSLLYIVKFGTENLESGNELSILDSVIARYCRRFSRSSSDIGPNVLRTPLILRCPNLKFFRDWSWSCLSSGNSLTSSSPSDVSLIISLSGVLSSVVELKNESLNGGSVQSLQCQYSGESDRRTYSAAVMSTHLAWCQKSQSSHMIALWFRRPGFMHTRQGNETGPEFRCASPADRNR